MDWKIVSIGVYVLALVVFTGVANRARGQECPRISPTGPTIPSQVRTLEGRLVFHEDIRGWFELKLNEPQCGQRSIQLVQITKKSRDIEVLRGCRVKSSGAIDFSPTGYYSLDTFQDVKKIRPVGTCSRQPLFPDYSWAQPDKLILRYRVDMYVNYRPGDHPITFHVRSAGRELRPWQAYASYWFTGGFVLYGHCAEGFVVDKVFGTPQANPGHFDEPRTSTDMAMFDPEDAAKSGQWDLRLAYTCIREPLQDRRKP
jgi:hypothetical protein